MATGRITKRAVDAIPLPKGSQRTYLWDDTLKGFGCMVTSKGARSYLVQYRIGGRGSPTKRYTIGTHGSPYTADMARSRAAEILELVRKKIDPLESERETLEAARADEEAQRRAEQEFQKLAFRKIAEEYITSVKSSMKSWRNREGTIANHLTPRFGDTPLTAITSDDLDALLKEMKQNSESVMRHSYAALRGIYLYARDTYKRIAPDPNLAFSDVIKPPQSRERQRSLTDDEIRAMWIATHVLDYPYGTIYRLLMLTGLRLREVADARWDEFELHKSSWVIPAERAKNQNDHWVPLSQTAMGMLKVIPRTNSNLLFPNGDGTACVSGFSKAKKKLEQAMLRVMKMEAEDRGDDPDAVKLKHFVIHDLRRTVATHCQMMGVGSDVVELMLGHVAGSRKGIRKIYQLYEYRDERIKAVDEWRRKIHHIVPPVLVHRALKRIEA